ncbi:SIMPL domain-containing protein [Microbulbifer sp. OS29]|uniref:SIMPL domain-containing protein n=1 Tax=Microbulbifer okhotskensis TaxID=2926617 RepID=A0A9X2ES22_9GAMM|nr:SIMPL domain-containing protein [Microbulbifer okhotskensis]MCO1336350.1 SIMPL domain-containing protein [Microbulbifer okhotskensis]
MKRLVLMVSLLIPGLSQATPEITGTPQDLRGLIHPQTRVVTLHGNAKETAYSDQAIINVMVTTEDPLLSNAIANNSNLREQLTRSLVKAGIQNSRIKNSKFSSSPQFGWLGKNPSSYKVINRVAVTIDRESQLQAIAQLTDQNKEIEIVSTSFQHSEEPEYTKKVQSKAIAKIMAQKADYEKILGIQLTPIDIRTHNVGYRGTEEAEAIEEVIITAARKRGNSYKKSFSDSYSEVAPVSFDEIQYEASLSVEFQVTPLSETN